MAERQCSTSMQYLVTVVNDQIGSDHCLLYMILSDCLLYTILSDRTAMIQKTKNDQ